MKFIEVEGPEFCGKSTQVQRLASSLTEKGYKVLNIRTPGTTRFSLLLREIIKDKSVTYDSYEDLMINLASTHSVIEYGKSSGADIVILDRFLSSMVVYQGYLSGELRNEDSKNIFHSFLDRVSDIVTNNLIRVYIRVSADTIYRRRALSNREYFRDRYDSMDLQGFERMVDSYDKAFSLEYGEIDTDILSVARKLIVDGENSEELIEKEILKGLSL